MLLIEVGDSILPLDLAKNSVRQAHVRTVSPCLSRWMSGRWPYASNRATSCRADAGASRQASAADSMANEPHEGQAYLNPRSGDDRSAP